MVALSENSPFIMAGNENNHFIHSFISLCTLCNLCQAGMGKQTKITLLHLGFILKRYNKKTLAKFLAMIDKNNYCSFKSMGEDKFL